MVKVKGRKGNTVSFEIRGIGEVLRMLNSTKQQVENGTDLGVVRAGTFIEEEVKESVSGQRAETKSVDSGLLVRSIEMRKVAKASVMVEPKRRTYPGTRTTTQDVATILEKGTTRVLARRHFKNTLSRNRKKIKDIVSTEIKQNIRAKKIAGL